MCKPGAACCGCDASASGLGVAAGVVALAAVISVTATLITDILAAVLVVVLATAALAAVLLAVILHRTRSLSGPPLRRLARPALTSGRHAVPALEAARPLPIENQRRLAIEAPRPSYPRVSAPALQPLWEAAEGPHPWEPRPRPWEAAEPRREGEREEREEREPAEFPR